MPAKYDQHFLVDTEAADAIVAAAAIEKGDAVLEIGPGRGILTERILKAGASLTAVELDKRLIPELSARFSKKDFRLVNADFLRADFASLPRPVRIVSNLPYSVGAPILQRLLDWPVWRRAVLMFQKEVCDRILASPGTKAYGPLTLSVLLKAEPRRVRDVPASDFRPPPNVDSAVVALDRRPASLLPAGLTEKKFFSVVKAAFGQRRKMAAKTLSGSLGLPRPVVEAAFAQTGIPQKARAETIPLDAFLTLASLL